MLPSDPIEALGGISAETLAQIASESWSCLSHVSLEPGNGAKLEGSRCIGWVHLTGDWRGVVALECSRSLAITTAADVFQLADDAVTDELATDVVGEVVNMVCGGIKRALASQARLSLPCVTMGTGLSIGFPGSQCARVPLRRGDEQVYLLVYGS